MEIIFNAVIGKYKRFIWRVLVLIWYNPEIYKQRQAIVEHPLRKKAYLFKIKSNNQLYRLRSKLADIIHCIHISALLLSRHNTSSLEIQMVL